MSDHPDLMPKRNRRISKTQMWLSVHINSTQKRMTISLQLYVTAVDIKCHHSSLFNSHPQWKKEEEDNTHTHTHTNACIQTLTETIKSTFL